MKTPKESLSIKKQKINKALINSTLFNSKQDLHRYKSEKSITTNESYTLLTDKNNKNNKNIRNDILQSNFSLNSIISPRFITIINNNRYKYRNILPNSITKLPKIQIISEADQLVKERKKHEGLSPVHITKDKAIQKSCEINLNNYIIRKIIEKREEIQNNDHIITEQFRKREKAYDKEYKDFLNLVELNIKNQKEEEKQINLLKLELQDKEVILNKEKLENKKLEEKQKRIINTILTYKKYGSFIHNIFEKKFIYDEMKKFDGKDYYKVMYKLIELYEKSLLDQNYLKEEKELLDILLLNADELFFIHISEMEDSLRRQLHTKNKINNKLINLNINNKNEIKSLNSKKKENQKDIILFNDKKNIEGNVIKHLKNYNNEETKKNLKYIIELNNSVYDNNQKNNDINIESVEEGLFYCIDTLNTLKEKESIINKYMKEIESIFINGDENDKILIEKIINDTKKYNKRQKLAEFKKIQEELQLKKNLKTISTQRIVIKGRKVIQDFPLIKLKKKKKKITIKKDNDDLDYLYYSSDEN